MLMIFATYIIKAASKWGFLHELNH